MRIIRHPFAQSKPQAVLFDLDGTLVDSAPDLGGTIQDMQHDRNMPITPLNELRVHASGGARGLLGCGFQLKPEDAEFESFREEFLERYAKRLSKHTTLFDGMEETLRTLETNQIAWGVVTNKHLRFASPLLRDLGLLDRCAVLIGGDSTPHPKPHPDPCLAAANQLKLSPEYCWFLGDDERDIISGNEAGMFTVATTFGYCNGPRPPEQWGSHASINQPEELIDLIELISCI